MLLVSVESVKSLFNSPNLISSLSLTIEYNWALFSSSNNADKFKPCSLDV